LLAAVKSTSEIKEPLKLQAVLEAIDDHYFTFEALNISETDLYNEDVTVCKKCCKFTGSDFQISFFWDSRGIPQYS